MQSMDNALPAAALKALLAAVQPEPPGPEVTARIMRRIGKRLAAEPRCDASRGVIDIPRDSGWRAFVDGAEMKVLHDDGRTMTWLVRMEAGAVLDGHDHAGDEECLVLEGDFWLNDVRYGPGDYQIAFAGTRHQSARTDSGCLVFVRSPSPKTAHAGVHA